MNLLSLQVIGLNAAVLLAGCADQRTIVLDQASTATLAASRDGAAQLRPVPVFSPCAAPAGTGPFENLSHPISGGPVPIPPRALAEHVSGCAGVRFRLDPDGKPVDIVVLTEYPIGYGFAHAAEMAVSAARWLARDDRAWRYLIVNMHTQAAS